MIRRFLIALALLATCPLYAAVWDLGPKRWEVASDAAEIDEDTGAWMVDLSLFPESFWTTVNSTDGRDIRATGSDGDTQKAVHIIGFVDSGTTGVGWLRVGNALSASTNAKIYVYAGDTGATMPAVDSTYGSEAAYDANVAAAYWFDGGSLADSTGNGYDLTAVNTPTATTGPVTGLSGYALNGSNQYLYHTGVPVSDWPITIIAWAEVNTTTGVYRIANLSSTSSDTPIALLEAGGSETSAKPRFRVRGNSGSLSDTSNTPAYSADTWTMFSSTRDANIGESWLYKDGVAGTAANTVTITTPTFTTIGIGASVRAAVSNYTAGTIGPVEFHNVVRSANYLATIHNMVTAPGTVYTVGTMEEAPAGDGETDWLEFTSVASSTGWTNPTYALTSLASAATYDIPEDTVGTPINLVDLDGAAAEITGESITGIAVEVVATGEDAGRRSLEDDTIRLIIGGTVVGTNKAIATQWTDASQVTRIYGGTGDNWSLTPADTDITAADFGISLAFGDHGNDGAALMSLYRVRVKIYYGAGSADTTSFFQFFD